MHFRKIEFVFVLVCARVYVSICVCVCVGVLCWVSVIETERESTFCLPRSFARHKYQHGPIYL